MVLLAPHLTQVAVRGGMVIDHVNGSILDMYFVNEGLVSLVKIMRDGRAVEVGAVGVEGLTDPTALFGVDKAVVETMVQISGEALRIRRDILRDEMTTVKTQSSS